MQGVKGVWGRVKYFLEGGSDDEVWEDDQEMVDYDGYAQELDEEESRLELAGLERRDRSRKKTSNVLDFDAKRDGQDKITVRISRPKEMQDATLICEYLQENMICIVDMQGVDHVTAQRIADYLGGVSYALRGQVERIDDYIFVMAPDGSKIDSDLKEELKDNRLFKSFR